MILKLAKWPNLFIVGAAKAGTTSLYHYLSQHPEIYMSPIKEPHFFSRIRPDRKHVALSGTQVIANERSYLRLFQQWQHEPLAGEASPSYLWEPMAASRIKQVSPNAKIIILLREPVSRAYSHYLNDVRAGLEKRSFLEAIEADLAATKVGWGVSPLYVALGLYGEQVKRYLDRFTQVKIIFFENLILYPQETLRQIFRFLQVEASYADRIEPEIFNPYAKARGKVGAFLLGTPKIRELSRLTIPPSLRASLKRLVLVRAAKPALDPQVRGLLAQLYAQEYEGLPHLLRQELPWQNPTDTVLPEKLCHMAQ
jgi:Sulfotransferase domain